MMENEEYLMDSYDEEADDRLSKEELKGLGFMDEEEDEDY